MPWTETNTHFSSQCLTQGVKISLLSFLNCYYILVYALSKNKKEKKPQKLPWVALGSGCVYTNPFLLLWSTYSLMSAYVELCGFIFRGKSDFFASSDTFSPVGTISPPPLSPRLKRAFAGRDRNVLGKQCLEWGEVLQIVWTELHVDFSWKDAWLGFFGWMLFVWVFFFFPLCRNVVRIN